MSFSAVVLVVILTIAVSFASKCPEFIERGSVDRKLLINSLTQIRNKVEKGEFDNPIPKAPLKKLVYDLQLEQHAKEYIETCKPPVDESKHNGLGYSKITIHEAEQNKYSWDFIISTKFASRGNNYNFSDPLNMQNEFYTKQFLQIINADTDKVGCDYGKYYDKDAFEERYYTQSYICFFTPPYKPHTHPYKMFEDEVKVEETVTREIIKETSTTSKPTKQTTLVDLTTADSTVSVTTSNYNPADSTVSDTTYNYNQADSAGSGTFNYNPSNSEMSKTYYNYNLADSVVLVTNSNYHPAKVVIRCEL